jgi:hypothetical protein
MGEGFNAQATDLDQPMNTLVGGGLASGVQSLAMNAKYMPLALLGPPGEIAAQDHARHPPEWPACRVWRCRW